MLACISIQLMRGPPVLWSTAYLGKRLHDGLSKPHPGAIGFKGLHSSALALALACCSAFSRAFPSAWLHTCASSCVQACGRTGSGPALAQICACGCPRACDVQFWIHSCLHIISRLDAYCSPVKVQARLHGSFAPHKAVQRAVWGPCSL